MERVMDHGRSLAGYVSAPINDYSSVSEDRGEPTTEIKNLTIRIAEKEMLRWQIC
jgi:hypothetical protein